MKNSGLHIDLGDNTSTILMMTEEYFDTPTQTQYDRSPTYYSWANYDTWGVTRSSATKVTTNVARGQWVNITMRCYAGTQRGSNGRIEFFIDGIYLGTAISSVPYRDTGDGGWKVLNIATFMGGGSIDYASVRDQWMVSDDFTIWKFKAGVDVPRGAEPSSTNPLRDITGSLSNVMPFPK
jgi:hypothetical protein